MIVAMLRWFFQGAYLWHGVHTCSCCGRCKHTQTLAEALVSGAASTTQFLIVVIQWGLRDLTNKLGRREIDAKSEITRDDWWQNARSLVSVKTMFNRYFFVVTLLLVTSTLMALHHAHPRLSIIGNTLLIASGDLFAFAMNFVSVNIIFLGKL